MYNSFFCPLVISIVRKGQKLADLEVRGSYLIAFALLLLKPHKTPCQYRSASDPELNLLKLQYIRSRDQGTVIETLI